MRLQRSRPPERPQWRQRGRRRWMVLRPPQAARRGVARVRTSVAMPSVACVKAHRDECLPVQCMVYNVNASRADTTSASRTIGCSALRRLLPDLRRRFVQPAMRGARMGAISARHVFMRSSTRRRARLRPPQPARPTTAVGRTLTPQAAATLNSGVESASTPTRSAPASAAARSCCAPVRPVLARPAKAPSGTMGVFLGYYRGSRRRSLLDAARGWLESGCEGMPGLRWVLHCPLGVLTGY
jgi:hypothetical protein